MKNQAIYDYWDVHLSDFHCRSMNFTILNLNQAIFKDLCSQEYRPA